MSGEILFGIPNKKATRHRVTKTGLVDRRAALLEIVRAAQPATVRQIFYLASVRSKRDRDPRPIRRVARDPRHAGARRWPRPDRADPPSQAYRARFRAAARQTAGGASMSGRGMAQKNLGEKYDTGGEP
jgi:hypothetical protein